MYRRLHSIAAAITAAAMSGCAELPRHNNTLVFFTTTSVALSVGADPTSTPKILLGYQRNEGVVMPLVANTGLAGSDSTSKGTPCPIPAAPSANASPCVLFGKRDRGVDHISDIPSVLATFKGNGSAKSNVGDAAKPAVEAGGGIVQYFATGIAAQLLAENGGAAAVSTAPAAAVAVMGSPERVAFSELLHDPAVLQIAQANFAKRSVLIDTIVATFAQKAAAPGSLDAARTAVVAAARAASATSLANALDDELQGTDAAKAAGALRRNLRTQTVDTLTAIATTFK